ncbi:MAG: AAA family ATPase [Candidatus Latescibacterota bacterium]
MPCTIAVAGKGGTGKTTLAALVTAHLLRAGKVPVLAVDADPNANLNEALGVEYDRTVVDTVEEIMQDGGAVPPGVSKGRVMEYRMHEALVESAGFDLLVMGRTEGPGCYCHANDLLRGFLSQLAGGYAYVVLDNEAGMEHLSRRTTRDVEVLLLAANPTVTAVRSAGRIHQLARQLKVRIDRCFLVLNRLNGSGGLPVEQTAVAAELGRLAEAGLPLLGEVPYDEKVMAQSVQGRGVLALGHGTAAAAAVARMMDDLVV